MMPTEEDLYARERELSEQIARLSHYDRELRAIQERLDLLTAREQSGMPLSPSDNEERDALLISQEATLAALQKDFPGVPETPAGIEQALTQYESEAYAVAVKLDEQVSQGLIKLQEPACDVLFPEQAPNQHQSDHHGKLTEWLTVFALKGGNLMRRVGINWFESRNTALEAAHGTRHL